MQPSLTRNFTGAGVLAATAVASKFTVTNNFAGLGTLSAIVGARFSVVETLAGAGALTATAEATKFTLTENIYGTGTLTSSAAGGFVREISISGTGSLGVTAQMYQIVCTAMFFSSGLLTPTADEVGLVSRNGNVQGTGSLAATAQYRYLLTSPFGGVGSLTAAATGVFLNSIESVDFYDLTDSLVSVQLVSPPDDDTEADFYLTDHGGHEIDIRYQSGSLSVVQDGIELATVTYDSALHQYQRMRESAGTLYFETSGDGVTWSTQITTIATPEWTTAVYVGLKTIGPGLVAYDNLNVLTARPALVGSGALSMTITAEAFLVRELIGAGVLSATALIILQASAILSGQGSFTVLANQVPAAALSDFFPFFFAGSIGSMT